MHSPNVAKNIETLVEARKLMENLCPPIFVNCDYEDYTKTKLYQNRFFVAGDGGYQEYIDKINIAKYKLPHAKARGFRTNDAKQESNT